MPERIALHKNAHLVVESTVTGTSNLNIDSLGDGDRARRAARDLRVLIATHTPS